MKRALPLFTDDEAVGSSSKRKLYTPLAEKLRPATWDEFQGLSSLDRNLVQQLKTGRGIPPSLILWGPPGSGKTTFARLVGRSFQCHFVPFSAVLGGVKEVRDIVADAKTRSEPTILFVDEIHRFTRAQQDAFLPHVENGTIILIGATTENPSFYLTGALLSRAKVVVLPPHSNDSLKGVLGAALKSLELSFSADAADIVCEMAGGDARRLINLLEAFSQSAYGSLLTRKAPVSAEEVKDFFKDANTLFYDRSGEEHYNMVSAFIKSLRGSNPDAALFWAFRMIESGEDPRFVIRRMMIFASEDIGNADPRALTLAVSTSDAYEKLGLPEGRIPLAQCVTYLATAPKSNRSYAAMNKAVDVIKSHPRVTVPLHLRNAPTKLMKGLGYGEHYEYPHDFEEGFVSGVQYLPDEVSGEVFYEPSERGYEKTIGERLAYLKSQKSKS